MLQPAHRTRPYPLCLFTHRLIRLHFNLNALSYPLSTFPFFLIFILKVFVSLARFSPLCFLLPVNAVRPHFYAQVNLI